MGSPDSDVEITPDLVSRLVAEQHPGLVGEVTFVAHGWDADIYRLGDELAVRLPRRAQGVPLVANEQHWLRSLAPRLTAPVPAAVAAGQPGQGYPWPWSIVPWYVGEVADRTSPRFRDSCAADLARFLVALNVPTPADAPSNDYRGAPLKFHDERVRGQLNRLGHAAKGAAAVWSDATRATPQSAPVWVHGDLHPGNALLNSDGRLAAIIDFGDLCGADPAVDLAAAWLFFTARGREEFRRVIDASGAYDSDVWTRAKGWSIAFSVGLIFESDGSDRMIGMGRAGLAAVLAEENRAL